MQKFKAIIEVFCLANILIIAGLWQVIFNNKRVDYNMILRRLPRNKKIKKPSDKEIFLDFMARNT